MTWPPLAAGEACVPVDLADRRDTSGQDRRLCASTGYRARLSRVVAALADCACRSSAAL